MVSTYTQNKVTWIDLENPTKEEIRNIMETYNLDPSVAEDLLDPTIRTRADIFADFTYFVLHFPLNSHKKISTFDKRSEELDFIIGKNFLITIHYSPIQVLLDFTKYIVPLFTWYISANSFRDKLLSLIASTASEFNFEWLFCSPFCGFATLNPVSNA